jgi:hypothetical protein
MVDLRILRKRSVAAGSLLALALGAAVFGSTYILPQFTQNLLGFTPTLSGDLFILRAVPIIIVAPILVRITGKVDPRVLLGLGFHDRRGRFLEFRAGARRNGNRLGDAVHPAFDRGVGQLGGSIAVAALTILGAGQTLANPVVRLFLHSGTPGQLSDLVEFAGGDLRICGCDEAIAVVCLAGVPVVLLMRKATARREAAVPLVKPAAPRSEPRQTEVKAA